MFVIQIQVYDYFAGTKIRDIEISDPDEAKVRYDSEKKKDFDYGDHYRQTRMFEIKDEGV